MARSIFVQGLSCAILVFVCSSADGARYVPVKISLNGEVILEGNASDDGKRNADEIWEALMDVNLRETDAFKKLKLSADLKEYKFTPDASQKGTPPPIKLDASYGGKAGTNELTIKRMAPVAPGSAGGLWRIDREEVDRLRKLRSLKE